MLVGLRYQLQMSMYLSMSAACLARLALLVVSFALAYQRQKINKDVVRHQRGEARS